MVSEFFKIFHHHGMRIGKWRWIKSVFLYSFRFFLNFLHWLCGPPSKISKYPGWIHLNSCCLMGLYWDLVQLWSQDLPNFQSRVPNVMQISHQEVDPEVGSSLHVQFFGLSRGEDHRDPAVLKCNLFSNWVKSNKIKKWGWPFNRVVNYFICEEWHTNMQNFKGTE